MFSHGFSDLFAGCSTPHPSPTGTNAKSQIHPSSPRYHLDQRSSDGSAWKHQIWSRKWMKIDYSSGWDKAMFIIVHSGWRRPRVHWRNWCVLITEICLFCSEKPSKSGKNILDTKHNKPTGPTGHGLYHPLVILGMLNGCTHAMNPPSEMALRRGAECRSRARQSSHLSNSSPP